VAGVTLPNDGSLALHMRFGFQRIGLLTEVGRKFGRYWDVAWLERPAS
jgi:phosphinothricin acetyltransferase